MVFVDKRDVYRREVSNYTLTKRLMEEKFSKESHDEMADAYGFKHDGDFYYIDFLGNKYSIDKKGGKTKCISGDVQVEADYNEAMTFFDILTYSSAVYVPSGEFVSIGSLPKATVAGVPDGHFFARAEAVIESGIDKMPQVIERLNARKINGADIAFIVPVFDFMDAMIKFWRSDDEFDASLQVYWDRNVGMVMHYETVWFMTSSLVEKICREVQSIS